MGEGQVPDAVAQHSQGIGTALAQGVEDDLARSSVGHGIGGKQRGCDPGGNSPKVVTMSEASVDEQGRLLPPVAGDETTMLLGFLDYARATLAWKTSSLDEKDLLRAHAPSTMTLAGLLKHLAWVEDFWFVYVLAGEDPSEPWIDIDWEADSDGDWNLAFAGSVEELRGLWERSCARSQAETARALSDGGMEHLAARAVHGDPHPSLRWIITHMIEEYSRHNGHADLIRESIDGLVGE